MASQDLVPLSPGADETPDVPSSRARPYHLTTAERRQLVRDLATGEVHRAALARKFGITRAAVTQFARRNAKEIDEIKANLEDEFAGQWIAQKELRIEQYQRDLELSAEGEFAGHYEQIRTRTQILHNVAEELGQLPTRGNITVVPVQHTIIGIDMDDLR